MKSRDLSAYRVALILVFPLILLSCPHASAIDVDIPLGPAREQAAQWLMETRGMNYRQAHSFMRRSEATNGLRILDSFSLPDGAILDFVDVDGAAAPGEPAVQHQGCGMFMSPHSEYGKKFWAEVEKRKGTPWYDNLMKKIGRAYDRGFFIPRLGPEQIANLQRVRQPGEVSTRAIATPYRVLVICPRFPHWDDRNPVANNNYWQGGFHPIGPEGQTPGGPLDANGRPAGLVNPAWSDTGANGPHRRVMGGAYPNSVDLINRWYTLLFDASNVRSVRNYYYQNSHGHIMFTGDRSDITGWLDSHHILDRAPLGAPPDDDGYLRQPGTPVIRPIGGADRIAYASATSDNRVTVLFSDWNITGRTTRSNYAVESPIGTVIDISGATVRADPYDNRRISIIGTAALTANDSFQVTFSPLTSTVSGTINGTVSLSNTLLTTADIVSSRSGNRLKSFCYYVHDHNFSSSADPYQLEHLRNAAGRVDDVGGTAEQSSDHEIRPIPYNHDAEDHDHPNLGYAAWEDSDGPNVHNSGTYRSDIGQMLSDYGISTAGYQRVVYLFPSDTGGGTFIPHGGGGMIMVPENAGLTLVGHELGHTFGLPDLYDTDFYWNSAGNLPPHLETQAMGPYSIMAHGVRMDAWCKIAAGWVVPVVLTQDLVPAQLPEIEGTLQNPVIFRLNVPGTSEYFLAENRNRNGTAYFGDSSPPGMYIYHVDPRFGQDEEKTMMVILEQADGLYELETTLGSQSLPGMDGDPWPGDTDNRNFTQLSAPDSRSHGLVTPAGALQPGTSFDSFVRIADISDAGALMTANLFVRPREVIVTGTSLAPANATQGQADVPMLRLTFNNQSTGDPGFGVSTNDVVISSIRIDESGNSGNDGDVQRVTLYDDSDGDSAFNPSIDAALANGTFSGQSATISGLNFRVLLGTANARDMFVVYNVSPTAQINPNVTVGVGLATFDYIIPEIPGAVQERVRLAAGAQGVSRFPIASGETVIEEGPDTLTVSPVDRAPAQVPRGTAGHEMLSLDLSVDHDEVVIDQVHIQEGGSSTVDTDVEQAYLYVDVNGDGLLDGGDTLLRSARFNTIPGPIQEAIFENLGYTVLATTPVSLLLVYDIHSGATIGSTVNVTIPSNIDIVPELVGGPPADQVSILNFPMSSGDSLIAIGPNDIPGAPSGLTAQDTPNDQGGSIDLSFTRSIDDGTGNDNVTEYRIYRANSSGGYTYVTPVLTVPAINMATYAVKDTTAVTGTMHYYVVRAWTGLAESVDSNEASATAVDNLAPLAIATLTAVDTPADNGGSIDLAWTGYAPPPDVDHYNVYRSTLPITTVAGLTPIASVPAPASSYTDATTVDGPPGYYYAVTPVDASGNENPLVTDAGPVQSVNNLIPAQVTTLTAVDTPGDHGGSISLDWTGYAPPVDFSHYNIYRGTALFANVAAMTPIATVLNPATTSYVDATTTDGVNYWYAVTCVDVASQENPSVIPAGPVQSVDDTPPPVTTLTAVDTPNDDGGSIDLDWTGYPAPPDTDDFNVYRSTSAFTNVAAMTPIAIVTNPAARAYADATTTDGVNYYYAVTAVDTLGNEDPLVTSVGPVQSTNDLPPADVLALTAQDTPSDDGGSIDLAWTAYTPPADAVRYNVYRSTSTITDVSAMTPIQTIFSPATKTATDATTTDLTDYYYAVTCVDAAGNEDTTVTDVGPVQSVNNLSPAPVAALLASDTPSDDGGSIDLDWSSYAPPADAASYNVYRSTSAFANVAAMTPIQNIANPATKTTVDTTTVDLTDYYYAVTCVDVAGNENPAVTAVGPVQSINNLPPPDVSPLLAQDTPADDGGSIDLDWTGYAPPADAVSYNVYRSTSSFANVASATLIQSIGNPATKTYTDATTTDGVGYHYAVTCVDVAGNEDTTVTSTGPVQSVNNLLPAPVATLTAQDTPADNGGSIDLAWTGYAPPADAASYNLYRSTSSFTDVSAMTPIQTIGSPATTTATDATTTDGVDYHYAVTCVDVAGNEDTTVASTGPVQSINNLPPPAVTTLTAADTPADDGGSIDLDWTGYAPPADGDLYRIYRATSPFANISGATLIATETNLATQTLTDTGRTDGVDYYYAVTCVDVVGNEDAAVTAVGPVQSINNLPPVAITTLTAQDTLGDTGGSIDLSWAGYTPPADIDHYDVYRSASEITSVVGLTSIAAVPAPADSYTDTTPVGTTLYYYAVVPVDVAGNQVTDVTDAGPVRALDDLAPLHTRDFRPGKRLLTMPATPADPDVTVQDIFTTTKVAVYDALAQGYVKYSVDPTNPLLRCAPGVGLWVDFLFHTDCSFYGRAASTAVPFEIGIEPSWNLAANPWLVNMPWSSVAPSPAGSASESAWVYDPDTGYQLVSAIPAMNALPNVPAYAGFWVEGRLNADKLVCTYPGAGTLSVQARSAGPAISWQVPVVVTAAGQRDACNAIGEADETLVIGNPPAVEGGVDAFLTPRSAPGSRAAYELRSAAAGSQVYDLTVATDLPDTDVTVSLPDLTELPKDRTVVLTDLDAGAVTHIRTTRSYTFNTGAQAGARQFAIEVRPAAEGALNIIGLSVIPSRGAGAEIRFEVSQPAAVSVRVHNIAGRLVSVVQQAQVASRGPVVSLWNGRTATGTAVPDGLYMLEVSAASDDGQRTRAVYPLALRR